MEKEINWIQGDILITPAQRLEFVGQDKGLLWFKMFDQSEYEVACQGYAPRDVRIMIEVGRWKQIKKHA